MRPDEGSRAVGDGPVAVVDIGSNSLRLVVFERLARAPLPVLNEKAMCRLGEGLGETGRLAPDAVDHALRALRRFGHIIRVMGAGTVDAVATEAPRRASNGAEFLRAAEAALGAPIEVLSGGGEARTAATGVAYSIAGADGVSGDLGGGSIDLGVVGPGGPAEPFVSVPVGTLAVRAALRKGRAAAERLVGARLAEIPVLAGAASGRALYAVGGGWRALGRIDLAARASPLPIVHEHAMPVDAALSLARRLSRLDEAALASTPGIPKRRVDTVAAAAFLLERLALYLKPERVVFSACGLREGRLFARLPPDLLAEDPLLFGAAELGRERGRSPGFGRALGAWTAGLDPDETAEGRRLRLAACELSDTGWRDHPGARARDTLVRTAHYPFLGIDHPGRAFLAIALFLRYEGSLDDPAARPLMELLSEPERRRASALGSALQLAYRLSGGLPALLEGNRLVFEDDAVSLVLADAATAPDEDVLLGRVKSLARTLGAKAHRIAA